MLIDLLDYWNFDPKHQGNRNDNWQHRDGSQHRFIAFATRSGSPDIKAIDLGPTEAVAGAIETRQNRTDGSPPTSEIPGLSYATCSGSPSRNLARVRSSC